MEGLEHASRFAYRKAERGGGGGVGTEDFPQAMIAIDSKARPEFGFVVELFRVQDFSSYENLKATM